VKDFSAVCYFMGRDLRARQKVPVGLIDSSWGGTAIDAWRSEAAIEGGGGLSRDLAVYRAFRRDPAEGNRLWGAVWEDWWRRGTGDRPGNEPWQPSAGGQWKPVPRLSAWEGWGDPELASYNGTVWFRTNVNLTPQQAAQGGTLDIGWADDADQTWVNGVPVGSTNGPNASRAYALRPDLLKAGDNSIVVNVFDPYAGGGLIGPEELRAITLADGTRVPLSGPWQYQVAPPAGRWPPSAPWGATSGLSTIYNAMIAPLGRYGLKGAAWYQGESDASTQRVYAGKLSNLMRDWRNQFAVPNMPFLVVQLAGWGPSPSTPVESGSATVRDEQRRAVAADPDAGLAVAIDLGDRKDIHPGNKQDVGLRLARAARHVAYGEAVSPSGPEVAGATRSNGRVTVRFANVEGALLTYNSSRPIAFELCGPDHASCRFVDGAVAGSTVTLDTDNLPATRVRFCWGDSPVCNLYDGSGLPAGPFEVPID
jgi:sialate O-acetylesterase